MKTDTEISEAERVFLEKARLCRWAYAENFLWVAAFATVAIFTPEWWKLLALGALLCINNVKMKDSSS